MGKVVLGLLAAALATIGAAKLTFEATAYRGSEPINPAWSQDRMEFVAWNNVQWTAWIVDGAFAQIPWNTSDWNRHSKASIAFVDWFGEPWQAKIDGESFLLAKHGDWNGPVERSAAIRYRDWSGNRQLRTVVQLSR